VRHLRTHGNEEIRLEVRAEVPEQVEGDDTTEAMSDNDERLARGVDLGLV
jgi:hypothetical protein